MDRWATDAVAATVMTFAPSAALTIRTAAARLRQRR